MRVIGFSVATALSESAVRVRPSADGARTFEGVTLIKSGLGNSRDRNYYPPETLQRAVREGRFTDLRAYIDHPDSVSEEIQPERTVRDWAGVYDNVRYNPTRRTVEADLTLFRSHKWLADTVEDLQKMGKGHMIGLSINGRGKTEPARRKLEEAGGEEVEVNEVKDFLELRSTDIVTEAGAGGGFVAKMLESARRSAQEIPMGNVNEKALKALKAGNQAEALRILEAAAPAFKKKAKDKVKDKTKPVEEAETDDEVEEAEQDGLEEAAEDVKAAALEQLELADEDVEPRNSAEEEDDAEDEDDEDDEDEDEGEDEEREANSASSNAFLTAAQRQRAQHAKTQEAKRRINGATGTTGTVNRKNTSFNKPDRGKGKRGQRKNTQSTMGFRNVRPGATVTVEAMQRQLDRLTRENETLKTRNGRLAEALDAHRSADRAMDLLRESEVPPSLHPGYLRQMIGKSEQGMREFIDTKLSEIDAIAESVAGRSGVEGAGSYNLRESGGYNGGAGSGLDDAFAGMPLKG